MGSTIAARAYAAAASSSYFVQQADAPWGLARLSHRENDSHTYLYDASAGQGTCAYILDTGIYVEHDVSLPPPPFPVATFSDIRFTFAQDFEGRAEVVANFVQGEDDDDLDGHGTHCTGTSKLRPCPYAACSPLARADLYLHSRRQDVRRRQKDQAVRRQGHGRAGPRRYNQHPRRSRCA